MKLSNLLLGFIPALISANSNIQENVEPLNIVLSLSFGGRSHIKYLLEISKILRDRGHSITYATIEDNFKFNKPYNYSLYSIGNMKFNTRDLMKSMDLDEMIKNSMSVMASRFTQLIVESFDDSFENYEKLFQTQKVDLIICDFFSSPCSDAARKHTVPLMIGFQGLNFGVGSAPFITPTMDSSPTTTETLSFYERFKGSVIDPIYMLYNFMPMGRAVNKVRAKYGVPYNPNPWGAFDEVFKISNTYIGFDDPRPIESTLKLVGPVTDDHIPPLDEELQQLMDSNKKIMYVAFGSHAVLNDKLLQKLMGAMQLAINDGSLDMVLWGLANTHSDDFPKSYQVNSQTYSTKSILDGTHPTIKVLKWAPQISILNHPNTKLFLSHGGIESSHEGIHSGTPILVMPILGDQPRNGRLIKNRGIGDFVSTLDTDSYELHQKIKELTRDDNIELQAKVKHIQAISKNNNAKRFDNALFLEHYSQSAKICRQTNPAKPFEIPCELEPYISADKRMTFVKAYKIDILLTVAGLGLSLVFFSLFTIYQLIRKFFKNPINNKQKEE